MNKFMSNELTSVELSKIKGGIFCELYIGYTETTGQRQNEKTMNNMETIDHSAGLH
jgi:hypothetical protein